MIATIASPSKLFKISDEEPEELEVLEPDEDEDEGINIDEDAI